MMEKVRKDFESPETREKRLERPLSVRPVEYWMGEDYSSQRQRVLQAHSDRNQRIKDLDFWCAQVNLYVREVVQGAVR